MGLHIQCYCSAYQVFPSLHKIWFTIIKVKRNILFFYILELHFKENYLFYSIKSSIIENDKRCHHKLQISSQTNPLSFFEFCGYFPLRKSLYFKDNITLTLITDQEHLHQGFFASIETKCKYLFYVTYFFLLNPVLSLHKTKSWTWQYSNFYCIVLSLLFVAAFWHFKVLVRPSQYCFFYCPVYSKQFWNVFSSWKRSGLRAL